MALEEKASLETQVAQVRGCMKCDPNLDVCEETCVAEECSLSFALTLVSSSFIP